MTDVDEAVGKSIPLMLNYRSVASTSPLLRRIGFIRETNGLHIELEAPQIEALNSTFIDFKDKLAIDAVFLVPSNLRTVLVQDGLRVKPISGLEVSLYIVATQENGVPVEFVANFTGGNPIINDVLLDKMGWASTLDAQDRMCRLPITFNIGLWKAASRLGIALDLCSRLEVRMILTALDIHNEEYDIHSKTTTATYIEESQTMHDVLASGEPLKKSIVTPTTAPTLISDSPDSTNHGLSPMFSMLPSSGPGDHTHGRTMLSSSEPSRKRNMMRTPPSSACSSCKDERVRCDGRYPRCSQCERFGLVCGFSNVRRTGRGLRVTSPPADSAYGTESASGTIKNLMSENEEHVLFPSLKHSREYDSGTIPVGDVNPFLPAEMGRTKRQKLGSDDDESSENSGITDLAAREDTSKRFREWEIDDSNLIASSSAPKRQRIAFTRPESRTTIQQVMQDEYLNTPMHKEEDYAASNISATGRARYPCLLRDSHSCSKTFTTSDHAARHSKIHTAEKSVQCTYEGCPKKFTRADNTKQHLETHNKDKSSRYGRVATSMPQSANDETEAAGDIQTSMFVAMTDCARVEPDTGEATLAPKILSKIEIKQQEKTEHGSMPDMKKKELSELFQEPVAVKTGSDKTLDNIQDTMVDITSKDLNESIPAATRIRANPIMTPTNTTRQVPSRMSKSSKISKLKNMCCKLLRKKPKSSHHRLDWICDCGESLFVDINKKSQSEITRLSGILQCSPYTPNQDANVQMGTLLPQHPSPVATSYSSSTSPRPSSQGSTFSPRSLSSSPNSSYSATFPIPTQSYLELCINTGEYAKTLSEIDLIHIGCDGELFKRIRSEYLRLRSFRSKLWLLKPSAVHFVKFTVQAGHRVGILQSPLSIPPLREVSLSKWRYTPCPLEDDPPMPQDIFLHYLTCTEFDPSPAWLPRLPKKLDTSILRFTGGINEGWGIHIKEGPNWGALGWINLGVLMLSGVVAGLWKKYTGDFQGAFGFAGWIVAVVNAVLVAWIARWSQV